MSVINNNLTANNALRNLQIAQGDQAKSSERLSSGLRINRAADDAAGLSISEGLRSQVKGLDQAARNAQDGINVLQTAEGGLTETHAILQRVRELAVQAGNDSNNTESRLAIKAESDALGNELIRMSESLNFNGNKLLDGNASLTFQVGAGGVAATDQIVVPLTGNGSNLKGLGDAVKALTFDSPANAAATVVALDTHIGEVSESRSAIGAAQNRLETTIKHVNVSKENLSAAESNIRDVDMAAEMVAFTRSNILAQAGTSILAQANQAPQSVLKLLG